MKFAILGSGFGLYGYLPALAEEGISICLSERYRSKFNGRSELRQYAGQISWVPDINGAVREIDGVVLAKRPAEQPEIVVDLVQQENIKYFLLEKPLAVTPAQSLELLNTLQETSCHFRIAYLFVYTKWRSILEKLIQDPGIREVHISWNFMSHHFRNDLDIWKRYNSQGGGAIRFYGIQAIALMAFLKYTSARDSVSEGADDQPVRWQATFIREGCPAVRWRIDSCASIEKFSITKFPIFSDKEACYTDKTPFAPLGPLDARVEPLVCHIRSLFSDDSDRQYIEWYNNVANLHNMVESLNLRHITR